eukprot:gnl/Hemi2/740_TR271_c0_g1_i1.p1 gnl/Hemi2/740_TR271_c0_g1~~gnl/Hemi2/740_TR271_c0_g1_i1.p1  ORF type:complete len:224 (+),score=35.40 gnl/Hemi2/740_TR271_c0_g1_i1:115-786(+)
MWRQWLVVVLLATICAVEVASERSTAAVTTATTAVLQQEMPDLTGAFAPAAGQPETLIDDSPVYPGVVPPAPGIRAHSEQAAAAGIFDSIKKFFGFGPKPPKSPGPQPLGVCIQAYMQHRIGCARGKSEGDMCSGNPECSKFQNRVKYINPQPWFGISAWKLYRRIKMQPDMCSKIWAVEMHCNNVDARCKGFEPEKLCGLMCMSELNVDGQPYSLGLIGKLL